jgi:hypothetical protein
MTDAALTVTQSAVEQFTERYLSTIGSSIEKRGSRWEITIPDTIETKLPTGTSVLLCGNDTSELAEDEIPLHPESSFFQTVLTDASERCPAGKLTLDLSNRSVELPAWLRDGDVDVSDTTFRPYYDRTAVVLLFRVSIETVSEYQTDLLRPIAIDTRSQEPVPGLTDSFLQMTSWDEEDATTEPVQLEEDQVAQLIDRVRPTVVERIQPKIDEVHQEASRAADAEVEEYRQMQQQKLEELESRTSTLSSKIDDLNERIQRGDDQEERVKSLKKRQELRTELEEVDDELEKLRKKAEHGFPERQREIRERHALEVVVTPLSLSQVEYESGEAEYELVDGTETRTITLGYGNGVGVTEQVHCDTCEQPLSKQRTLQTLAGGIHCTDCVSTTDS